MLSSRDVLGQKRHGLCDLGLRSDASDRCPGSLVVRNCRCRINVVRHEIAGRSSWLTEQHEGVTALDRVRNDRHRANTANVVGQLDQVARRHTELCGICGMDFKVRHRIMVVIERDMLMVVERLPDVVRAPIVDPEGILPTLCRDLCTVSRPGLWGRNKTCFPRGSLKSAMLVHPNGSN